MEDHLKLGYSDENLVMFSSDPTLGFVEASKQLSFELYLSDLDPSHEVD